MVPATKWWVPRDSGGRLAIGEELLRLQGMDISLLPPEHTKFPQHFKADLAGNAFCAGSYMVVFLMTILKVPLECLKRAAHEAVEDTEAAVVADVQAMLEGL